VTPDLVSGEADQPRRHVRLAGRGATAALAGMIERYAGPCQTQNSRVDKGVAKHGVGTGEGM